MGVVEELVRARDAYDRREWVAAYDGLSAADDTALTADDFARLATVAYLVGRRNDCIQALQRAHASHLEAGDVPGAVRAAFWLALVLVHGGEPAVAGGWVSRAQRLLDDLGQDCVEQGYVLVHVMFRQLFSGDADAALAAAQRVDDYGRRYADLDLRHLGRANLGRVLMRTGRVPEGLALLDEAMVGVSAGEVSPVLAGDIYCSLVEACQEVSDLGRAAEWTMRLARWCDAQPGLVAFTGQCAVHRGQIMKVRGAFAEAVEELDGAVRRYESAGSDPAAGLAWAERGDVLRIRGDHAAADESFQRAVDLGHDPQPALARLRLAQGRTDAAVATVRRLLAEPRDPVGRSQLLPGAVEVLLVAGDVALGRDLADELGATAERFGVPGLLAAAHHARGHALLSGDDPASAGPVLQAAARTWAGLDAPYEAARSRALLGRALVAAGDEESGLAELEEARRTFAALGARPDLRAVAALLHHDPPGGLSAREVEVLRLVAAGLSNPEIAAALVLSEKTVARHLSNIFTKLDVRSRTAAAAFAYEQRLV